MKAQGYRPEESARAARRAAEFLLRFARRPRHFREWGSDFLNYFYVIADTAADPSLRRWARVEGSELARRWRDRNPSVAADADIDAVYDLVYGSLYADPLGVRDRALKSRLRAAAARFTARDLHGYDPAHEPPPSDVPDGCRCQLWNERGRKTCAGCRRRLSMSSRYGVWYMALIRTYMAERYGVSFGVSFADVLRWLPSLRPYPAERSDADFVDAAYSVTHVVYTLNDYNRYRLRPAWLPREFAFLKSQTPAAIAAEDPEMVGEFLECLKCFGLGERSPLIRAGTDFLLARQNADGSWGETGTDNTYANYHTTLAAAGGLTEVCWRAERLAFPELEPLLSSAARRSGGRRVARPLP